MITLHLTDDAADAAYAVARQALLDQRERVDRYATLVRQEWRPDRLGLAEMLANMVTELATLQSLVDTIESQSREDEER